MFHFISDGQATSEYAAFLRIEQIVFEGSKLAAGAIMCEFIKHIQLVACGFGFFANTGEPNGVVRWEACEWGQMWENQFWNNGVDPDGTIFAADTLCFACTNTNFGCSFTQNIFGPDCCNTMYLDGTAQGNLVQGNHFAFNPTGYALVAEGFKLTIENNYVYPFQGTAGIGPTPTQEGIRLTNVRQCIIQGNFLEDIADAPGIVIQGNTRDTYILNNFIQEIGALGSPPVTQQAAILVDSSAGARNVIAGNVFFNNNVDHLIEVEDIGATQLDIHGNISTQAAQGTGPDIEIHANATNVRVSRFFDRSRGYTYELTPDSGPSVTTADTTPSVRGIRLLILSQPPATVITNFDDGYVGQELNVLFVNANSTIQFSNANFRGNGGADLTGAAGQMVRFIYDGAVWHGLVVSAT